MWVYTVPAISQHFWHTEIGDASSPAYNEAGNWAGICFGAYSLFAAIYSIFMPRLARITSRKFVYSVSLLMGGLGYLSIYLFQNPHMIILSMVGVGMAWAAILAMPYAILSNAIPSRQMGIYMGIFNFTIAGPQILSGLFGGSILKNLFHERAIFILMLAGCSMIIGATTVFFVKDKAS